MLSLKERINLLEQDLKADPPRISVYHDLPYAILRYDPEEEWELRRELRMLAVRLAEAGKEVVNISLAGLLWEAIQASEGIAAVVELEKERGFLAAQEQVTVYLSDRDWCPLRDLLAEKLNPLHPRKNIVFLTRAAAMAPALYHMSRLLDEMHGRTQVTTVLFYPGTLEGTAVLRFMGLKEREALGNYRVKIYG
ncbi:MAG: BREX protein BrxB domain-containing protein [Bacillota bacterium]